MNRSIVAIPATLAIAASALVAGCNPLNVTDKCPNGYFAIGEGFCRNIECYARSVGGNGSSIAATPTYAEDDRTAVKALEKEGKSCGMSAAKWGDQTIKVN